MANRTFRIAVGCVAARLGADQSETPTRSGDMLIDEVAIWDRVLSEAERALLFNNGRGMPLPTLPFNAQGNGAAPPQP